MRKTLQEAHGAGYLFLIGFLFVAAMLLPGCGSIAKQYVEADRKTFDAIAPEYSKYVEADESLDDDAKKLRLANVASWGYRLEQAEKVGE